MPHTVCISYHLPDLHRPLATKTELALSVPDEGLCTLSLLGFAVFATPHQCQCFQSHVF